MHKQKELDDNVLDLYANECIRKTNVDSLHGQQQNNHVRLGCLDWLCWLVFTIGLGFLSPNKKNNKR